MGLVDWLCYSFVMGLIIGMRNCYIARVFYTHSRYSVYLIIIMLIIPTHSPPVLPTEHYHTHPSFTIIIYFHVVISLQTQFRSLPPTLPHQPRVPNQTPTTQFHLQQGLLLLWSILGRDEAWHLWRLLQALE
jgi:hypothetical protein